MDADVAFGDKHEPSNAARVFWTEFSDFKDGRFYKLVHSQLSRKLAEALFDVMKIAESGRATVVAIKCDM